MTLPTDPAARKAVPIYSGFIKYFPRAICAVAELSRIGNDQHNPGQPLHWDRAKSRDELDALMRHLVDDAMGVPTDTDNVLHATKLAWRAMANLEKALEARSVEIKPTFAEQLPQVRVEVPPAQPGAWSIFQHDHRWPWNKWAGPSRLAGELSRKPSDPERLIEYQIRGEPFRTRKAIASTLCWEIRGAFSDILWWRYAD